MRHGPNDDSTTVRRWLLCLNLQREFITAGRPLYASEAAAAATRARICLSVARELGWRVAHIQVRRKTSAGSRDFERPIEGLEPLPSEAVFVTENRSALSHPILRTQLVSSRPEAIYAVGFSLAHEGLASVFDAAGLDLPLQVVEDASASPSIGDRSARDIDRAALAIAASVSGVTSSAALKAAKAQTVILFQGA
ncbi:MAG: isochorismatase family protein [Pseudomonadota bacterium]